MKKTNTIAIMGSPASGKTITTMKLATALAGHKKSVIIVTLDGYCPVIPYIMPSNVVQERSFGELLRGKSMSESDVFQACTPIPNHTYLKIVGYRLGETNHATTEEEMINFLSLLQLMADYILVDCTSRFDDLATKVAVEFADVVFQLGTSTTKGLTYYANADSLYQVDDRGIFLVGNYKKGQPLQNMKKAYGEVEYVLPYCEELERQLLEVNLFTPLETPASKGYREEMQKILADVFKLFPEKKVVYKKRPFYHRIAFWLVKGEGKGEF